MTEMQSEEADPHRPGGAIDAVNPRAVQSTGDDSPAGSLLGYVWRMSGMHQIGVALVAILVALLDLAPIELQRRLIDGAMEKQSFDMLLVYAFIYLGIIVFHQIAKLALRLYQGWISESAILYSRRHLMGIYKERVEDGKADGGNAVAILSNEIDKLGGFVGEGVAQAATNIALLLGATIYMLMVEPKIALLGLAFMVPQILLTPFMQRKLNALVAVRVGYVRELSGIVTDEEHAVGERGPEIVPKLYGNRMRFYFVKFGMKALLNLLNALAPLTVLIFGGYMVIEGNTTVGVIVAFLAGFQRVSDPLRSLISFYRTTAQASVQHCMIANWMEENEDRDCG